MEDAIHERGKALEDLFFAELDQQLLSKMKAEMTAEESRNLLAKIAGIHDDAVLQQLLSINISPETLACLGMIPLVVVAWADKLLDAKEKAAILEAAEASGIARGSAAAVVLGSWLSSAPPAEIVSVWKNYVAALKKEKSLTPAALENLKTSMLDRATKVAQATGGILGLGNKVSAAEAKVLADLSAAFS